MSELIFLIKGKVVLVIGGISGIGYMIVEGLVKYGVKVYVVLCKVDVCVKIVEVLFEFGECIGIVADLFME